MDPLRVEALSSTSIFYLHFEIRNAFYVHYIICLSGVSPNVCRIHNVCCLVASKPELNCIAKERLTGHCICFSDLDLTSFLLIINEFFGRSKRERSRVKAKREKRTKRKRDTYDLLFQYRTPINHYRHPSAVHPPTEHIRLYVSIRLTIIAVLVEALIT